MAASVVSSLASATNIQLNEPLPAVTVDGKGEVVLNGDEHRYASWSSQQLTGKIRTIQHIAGRASAKAINDAFIEALKQTRPPL